MALGHGALVVAVGCGGTVETEDGSGGAAATSSSTGAPSVGGGPPASCTTLCEERHPDGCFAEDACVAYCDVEAAGWPPGGDGAFAACVEESPLCFETIEGCMLSQLHPEGSIHTLRLVGSGFSPLEGAIVEAFLDPAVGVGEPQRVAIEAGQFIVTWEEPIPVFDGRAPVVLMFVDVDGDGTCKPGVDPTGSQFPEWNGDLAAPEFEARVEHPLVGAEWVCDSAP